MDSLVKILVVEDEMIIGAKISLQLTTLGYEVVGILPRGEEAVNHVKEIKPDIVLLDINLKGKIDGIETAHQINQLADAPIIIYLTANADEATFNRAKSTKPAAFISKPFKQLDLQRAIELSLGRVEEKEMNNISEPNEALDEPLILSDRIFIRHKEKMIKILLSDILFIEADRNYSRIFTSQKEYMISGTLKSIEEKISDNNFLRIHRSFLVNLVHVDEVTENFVLVEKRIVPLSEGLKENLLHRILML